MGFTNGLPALPCLLQMQGTPLKVQLGQGAGDDAWRLIVDRVARRHMDFNQVGGGTGAGRGSTQQFGYFCPFVPVVDVVWNAEAPKGLRGYAFTSPSIYWVAWGGLVAVSRQHVTRSVCVTPRSSDLLLPFALHPIRMVQGRRPP